MSKETEQSATRIVTYNKRNKADTLEPKGSELG